MCFIEGEDKAFHNNNKVKERDIMKAKKEFDKVNLPEGSILEIYTEDNLLHQDAGPAIKLIDSNGTIIEIFCRAGKLEGKNGLVVFAQHPTKGGAKIFR